MTLVTISLTLQSRGAERETLKDAQNSMEEMYGVLITEVFLTVKNVMPFRLPFKVAAIGDSTGSEVLIIQP